MQLKKIFIVGAGEFAQIAYEYFTHDSDFGTLAIARQQPITGIVYLRPGHIQPEFTLATLEALRQQEIHVAPPFIIVALRQQNEVRVRIRQM